MHSKRLSLFFWLCVSVLIVSPAAIGYGQTPTPLPTEPPTLIPPTATQPATPTPTPPTLIPTQPPPTSMNTETPTSIPPTATLFPTLTPAITALPTETPPASTKTTTPSETPQETSIPVSTATDIAETPTVSQTPTEPTITSTSLPTLENTSTPTETSLPPEPTQLSEVFLEDFNQMPDSPLWTIPQTWFQYDAVPDVGYGLFVMQSQHEAILNYSQLDDYAIEVEFANNSGTFILSTQAASTQGYTLMIDLTGTLNLYRDGLLFATTTIPSVEPGGWRHLRISDFSDVIRISIDGQLVVEFQDNDVSLEELAFSFQFVQGAQPINIGAIDNLSILVESSEEIQQRAMIQAQSTPPNLNFVPQSANCSGYGQQSSTANFVAYQSLANGPGVIIEAFEVDATGTPIVQPVMNLIASVTGPIPTGSTIDSHQIWDPAISPNGTRLAYVAKYQHTVNGTIYNSDGVYILDLATCSVSAVAGPNDQLKDNPDWSPDGTMIAYDRFYLDLQGNRINEVIIVNLNTGSSISISNAENPAWSPDLTNQRLTYTSVGTSASRNIWIYDLGSNISTQITTAGFFSRTAWSSDGSQLVFEYPYSDPAMQQFKGIYTAAPVLNPTLQLMTPVSHVTFPHIGPVWSADPDGVYPDHIMFTDLGTGQQTSVIEQIMYVSLSSPTIKVQMTFNEDANTNPDWWAPSTTCPAGRTARADCPTPTVAFNTNTPFPTNTLTPTPLPVCTGETTAGLNVRPEPSTALDPIGYIPFETSVTAIGITVSGQWILVQETAEYPSGWVNGGFLNIQPTGCESTLQQHPDNSTPIPTSTPSATYTPTVTYTPSNTPLPTNTPMPTATFTPDFCVVSELNVEIGIGVNVRTLPSETDGQIVYRLRVVNGLLTAEEITPGGGLGNTYEVVRVQAKAKSAFDWLRVELNLNNGEIINNQLHISQNRLIFAQPCDLSLLPIEYTVPTPTPVFNDIKYVSCLSEGQLGGTPNTLPISARSILTPDLPQINIGVGTLVEYIGREADDAVQDVLQSQAPFGGDSPAAPPQTGNSAFDTLGWALILYDDGNPATQLHWWVAYGFLKDYGVDWDCNTSPSDPQATPTSLPTATPRFQDAYEHSSSMYPTIDPALVPFENNNPPAVIGSLGIHRAGSSLTLDTAPLNMEPCIDDSECATTLVFHPDANMDILAPVSGCIRTTPTNKNNVLLVVADTPQECTILPLIQISFTHVLEDSGLRDGQFVQAGTKIATLCSVNTKSVCLSTFGSSQDPAHIAVTLSFIGGQLFTSTEQELLRFFHVQELHDCIIKGEQGNLAIGNRLCSVYP